MKTAKKFFPTLLVGMLAVMVCSSLAIAEGDPLEDLNSWYYPYGQEELDGWYYGWYARGGATYYDVEGDDGRFRHDRFIDDQLTGGIEQFSYNQENWDVSVRAIIEDDFAATAHYLKPDVFRVDFDFRKLRKYYDISNDPWDPIAYGFDSERQAIPSDDNIYADRVDLNLEGQLLIPEIPNLILGWHHWERYGDEVLLRGERVRVTGDPIPRQRITPAVSDLDGESDTLYAELPFTFAEKYNLKLRQEYEDYEDDQFIEFSRFQDGNLEQQRIFDDEPGFEEFRTLISFDSFFTENIYGSANYYHSDLENTFSRDEIRFSSTGVRDDFLVNSDTDNDRVSDVLAFGLVFFNIMQDTKLHTNLRIERSDTDSESLGFEDGVTPHQQMSDIEETRLGESVALVWQGLSNTTVTLAGLWEQRYMDIAENVDTTEHELSTDFDGPEAFIRDTDVDHMKQEYTVTVVNRPRTDLRLTARYRFKDNEEDYDDNVDQEINDPSPDVENYPGVLGDLDQQTHEITLKSDWHFLPAWTASAQYQFEDDEIEYEVANTEGEDLQVHRLSATVYGSPIPRLVLTGMAMYENFDMDTPTDAPAGSNWDDGTAAYEIDYDSYVAFLSGNYVISDKWSANLSYQRTQNSGSDVDNVLDEVWLGAEYKLTENKTVSARYEYFDFDDEFGDGFNDYQGHGIYLALAYRF